MKLQSYVCGFATPVMIPVGVLAKSYVHVTLNQTDHVKWMKLQKGFIKNTSGQLPVFFWSSYFFVGYKFGLHWLSHKVPQIKIYLLTGGTWWKTDLPFFIALPSLLWESIWICCLLQFYSNAFSFLVLPSKLESRGVRFCDSASLV